MGVYGIFLLMYNIEHLVIKTYNVIVQFDIVDLCQLILLQLC